MEYHILQHRPVHLQNPEKFTSPLIFNGSQPRTSFPYLPHPTPLAPKKTIHQSKSMDNLHFLPDQISQGNVTIANNLRIVPNEEKSYRKTASTEMNLNVQAPIPIYVSNANVFKNHSPENGQSQPYIFSENYLVKREPENIQEENIPEELEKNIIKILSVKISQGQNNEYLLLLETKRRELENLQKQNQILKLELRKQTEKKVKSQLVESTLIENQTLNLLLKAKTLESSETQLPINPQPKYPKINEIESNIKEIRNKMIEENILQRSKIRIISKIEEKRRQLKQISEEASISELTFHIERLSETEKNDPQKRIKNIFKDIYLKIAEVHRQINAEIQRSAEFRLINQNS